MMRLAEAAQALNTRHQGDDVLFTGVSTDSRTLNQGDLFIALTGERFNGHQFVRTAQQQGAAAAMVGIDANDAVLASDLPLMRVENTQHGLGQLAAYWRQRFNIPVVAVTGSNGKTTVKEMLAAILNEAVNDSEQPAQGALTQVLATMGNLNNEIGLPLMLLRLRETHRYAVFEMGMNHSGEIDYLTHLARPDVALITNANAAHIEGLGSIDAVAHAKGEIFNGLNERGTAVVNADDSYAPLWRELAGNRRIIEFGLQSDTQISAAFETGILGSRVQLKLPGGMQRINLKVPGLHNVRNSLAAAAAAVALGIDDRAIVAGLERFTGVKGRLQIIQGRRKSVLIDDSYNANPGSVRAAMAVLAAAPGRRIMVLGDMGELGATALELHREIGAEARELKLDKLLTLGELSRSASEAYGKDGHHFSEMEALLDALENWLDADVTVLIKGSRFMHMERLVERLEA